MNRLFLLFGIDCLLAAAGDPFAGRWKLNPARSTMTGDTVRIEALPGGEYKLTSGQISDTFRMDGKDYPSHFGQTIAASQLNERTWQLKTRKNGRPLWTETWDLVPDGKTANITVSGTTPEGKRFEDRMVRRRAASSSGLAGAWTAGLGLPDDFEIQVLDADGRTVIVPARKLAGKCAAEAGKRTGPRSIEVADRMNGKVVTTWKCTVSPDGRTLTQVGNAVDSDKLFTLVFERQR